MPETCHRVGIAAPRHRVYEDFATKGALVEFWTPVSDRRWAASTLRVHISPTLLTSTALQRASTQGQFPGETQAGTNDRACGLGGGHARRSYRHRLPSQVNRTMPKQSNDEMSPRLSGKTRLFLAGNSISMLGTGLVLPFMIIYLHEARGIALPVVGALLAAGAATGLMVVLVCGALMDRVGARLVLGMILLGQVVAEVALAWAHNTLTALPAVLIYGATWAPMFGAISTMLNGLTLEPALKQRAFAVNFATQNMALGIGAAVAAVVVRAHHPGTFQVLFLANGLSCLLFAVLLPALPNLRRTRVVNETRVGYRYVLSHRGLRLMILASLLLGFIGPGSFDSGVPAFRVGGGPRLGPRDRAVLHRQHRSHRGHPDARVADRPSAPANLRPGRRRLDLCGVLGASRIRRSRRSAQAGGS